MTLRELSTTCRAGSAETYEQEVQSNASVQEAVAVLNGCLRSSEAKALLFQGPYQKFSQLWASDLPAALQASQHALVAICCWQVYQPSQQSAHGCRTG